MPKFINRFEVIVELNAHVYKQIDGQCSCKANVQGRQCNQCLTGFFNLQSSNVNGCEPCNCSTAGTINSDISCDAISGQCHCKANVRG